MRERLALPSDIPVCHITTAAELLECVALLLANHAVLAMDVEWRPRSAVPALLQVASEDTVALIDLVALRDAPDAPAAVRDLLTSPAVVRLGWRFRSDLKVLSSWMPCLDRVEGYVEMADAPVAAAESAGLAGCVQAVLGVDLCKAQQCSDWEARPLSDEQVRYAALDAYVLLLIAEQAGPDLPRPVTLKTSSGGANNGGGGGGGARKERFMPRPGKSLRRNPAKRAAFITRFCVKTQAYSNSRILSASGALVAHCDRGKAMWYLSRGLATHVSGSVQRGPVAASEPDAATEGSLTVRLLFRPEDRNDGTDFERVGSPHPRRNRCVVCGAAAPLSRYHLVPRSYQKHFETSRKAHRSHDVVLLCVDCHEASNRHVAALKLRIAAEFDAPLRGEGLVAPTAAERAVVKSAAALLRGVERVPEARADVLRATVCDWWGGNRPAALAHLDALDRAALEYSARLGRELPRKGGWQAAVTMSDAFRPHGKIVVDRLLEDRSCDALSSFIVRWRLHFLRSLAPRFMPDDWSLYHRVPGAVTVQAGADSTPPLPVTQGRAGERPLVPP
jgi:exonuclease 3'-5' domain-containing protein 2